MRSREDIESYLLRAHLGHQPVGDSENMWLVHEHTTGENIIINLVEPLVLFRCKIMELSSVEKKSELFEQLLKLNTSEMVHGAYGIDNNAIVLTCALRSENLDYNEFQATIDDFSLAITNHYETLSSFRTAAA